jgi:hypothetical protein
MVKAYRGNNPGVRPPISPLETGDGGDLPNPFIAANFFWYVEDKYFSGRPMPRELVHTVLELLAPIHEVGIYGQDLVIFLEDTKKEIDRIVGEKYGLSENKF